ncbi:MAG TPA: aminodeoxychorismate lyase [Verrucomicrobiae bacterium]|nr:aminodeoxychorismate lyase [Verrucomicrobiae bacterium]
MIVFLNGSFVPEERAMVSVFDRSFLYGDGLFETMLIANGIPFRWSQHLERIERGAALLGITLPFQAARLWEFASKLVLDNQMPNALLRLTLSRGVGLRGYSPRGADSPAMVMSLHPAPVLSDALTSWKLATASVRLPANEPLAQLKHANKLPQILARAQAEQAGADEALLVNTDGFLVEGASSNLFWIEQGTVSTPPLSSGILAGVTRLVVFELCQKLGVRFQERNITPPQLVRTEGVFVSLSSYGLAQGVSLDGHNLRRSDVTLPLHRAYVELVQRETASA